jgi:hypothetical protein
MRIANLFFCLFLSLVIAFGAAAVPNQNVVRVDCNAGGKVQAAVDANSAPLDIVISGICTENVVIRDKDVNLRGSSGDPTLDGIRGKLSTTPALTVRGSVIATIRSLSFSNSAGQAVSIQSGANETISSCRFENNGNIPLQVTSGAMVIADSLTFNANTGRSIAVSGAQFFCTSCDVSGNGFALVASRGAIASLLDTVISGGRGILASDGGTSADIDCASVVTSHPCMINVTGVAAQADTGARATLLDVGDFTGQLMAEDAGTVSLIGARQTSGATNDADFFGRIVAEANVDVNPPTQSLLRATNAAHFARVLVTDNTVIQGAIQCTAAADAVLDATVTVAQGATITGCEHASTPLP